MGRGPNIPQEHKDAMVELYLQGKSCKEAASVYGYSNTSCSNALKQKGILVRNVSNYKKRNVNNMFFDKIDSEIKAYWLGFLTADGNITPAGIQIYLARKDREHLAKFLQAIDSEHTVKDRVSCNKEQSYISIKDIKLSEAIQKLGVVPKKSLIVKPYLDLNDDLIRHYWRGYVDGNGCIMFKSNVWFIDLIGCEFMIDAFTTWCSKYITSKIKAVFVGKVKRIRYSSNKAIPIINELYRDCNIYLARKMELAHRAIMSK